MPAVGRMLIAKTILWLSTGRTCFCIKRLYAAVHALCDSKAAVCCYFSTDAWCACKPCLLINDQSLKPHLASSATAGPEGCALSGLGLDDVHTPRGLSHSMPSDDSQLDALEHTVDVAAVQNSLAHMSMPHGGIKNSRRPQANSPGGYMHLNSPLMRQLNCSNSLVGLPSVHLRQ